MRTLLTLRLLRAWPNASTWCCGNRRCLLHTGHEILAVNLLAPWGLYVAYDALAKSPNALAEEARFYDYTQATTCALSAVQFLQVLRDFL